MRSELFLEGQFLNERCTPMMIKMLKGVFTEMILHFYGFNISVSVLNSDYLVLLSFLAYTCTLVLSYLW